MSGTKQMLPQGFTHLSLQAGLETADTIIIQKRGYNAGKTGHVSVSPKYEETLFLKDTTLASGLATWEEKKNPATASIRFKPT